MTGSLDVEPKTEIRKFGTIVAELELLRDWLIREGCSHAVMESTGSYWKPVFNILENSVEVVLANGRILRIGADIDMAVLKRIAAALEDQA